MQLPLLTLSISIALVGSANAAERTAIKQIFDLPPAAQASISTAIGRTTPAYFAKTSPGEFDTENVAQGLRTRFTPKGIELHVGDRTLRMSLRSYGYQGEPRYAAHVVPQAVMNRVEYRRGDLTEWYVNGPAGLEQGFTIGRLPAPHARGPLTITLGVFGDLTATADRKTALIFADQRGAQVLRYSGLRAIDANGVDLPARLELRNERVQLIVDDARAKYPVVIDPIVQLAQLTPTTGKLGSSVAVSGNTVVVSAAGNNIAYVFVKPTTGWANMTETALLTTTDSKNDASSVSINGNTIVLGTPLTLTGGTYIGAAYVYVKPASGWTSMTQTAKLTASDGMPYDTFGTSVAVSGNTVVIGAQQQFGTVSGPGKLYVFVKPASGWVDATETAQLTASDGVSGNGLGWAVAINGNTILGATFDPTLKSEVHEAYVFVEPPTGWTNMTETAKLTGSDVLTGHGFGYSASMSSDTIALGQYAGGVYVFVKPATGWVDTTETAKLTVKQDTGVGDSVAISGNTVLSASPYQTGFKSGVVYVFHKPASGWVTTTKPNSSITDPAMKNADDFGVGVAVNGNTVVITAFSSTTNLAYVFGP